MEPARPSDRLFFAVFPDEAAAAYIEMRAQALRAAYGLRGKPLLRDRFHVTLHHLGDYAGVPDALVAQARQAADAVAVTPFQAVFDQAGSFSGHGVRPCVLRGGESLDALRGLQQALGRQMQAAGLARQVEHRFEPHVTLLYDARAVPMQPTTPVGWQVTHFALVHSLLGKTEYRMLGHWPLG